METNKNKQEQENNEEQQPQKGGIHNNALYAASMGRPATAQVNPHSNEGLAQTGTNNSYEGPLGAGSGGAAGTGYTSGQAGTGATVATDYGDDATRINHPSERNNDELADEAQDEINEQR